ncbi:hypothetical protein BABINDRAFT_160337 [Babjeviella inositovora NRRL Y-12698]|uniref:F-box domain-containing protein n=1 Tax=Babjeviella inositovora NRRL Y-12698 TaxID=984486 RepID=A0A1E3QWT8_9ASCO|nr:uncharacterized protein BABINDRAFT_160337 [Babjeviella inositovora NRRL Y-12698]ODQ82159.1 hypothetical protein BABINDRAFT_160337 [Babjeviella inositovora NRRL Y-12698]
MKPVDVDYGRLAQMPDHIIQTVFALLPKTYMPAFFNCPELKDLAAARHFSKLRIWESQLPGSNPYDLMSFEEFESFSRRPEFADVPMNKGVISVRTRDIRTLAIEALQRLESFRLLSVNCYFYNRDELNQADVPVFVNVHRLLLMCSFVDWLTFELPPNLEQLTIIVQRDPLPVSRSRLFPLSLLSVRFDGVDCSRGLLAALPPALQTLDLERMGKFSVSDFNKMRFANLKVLSLGSRKDVPLSLEGILLPPTLTKFNVWSDKLSTMSDLILPPSLKELKVCCPLLHDFGFELIEGLERLHIVQSSIYSATLDRIEFPRSLTSLAVSSSLLSSLAFIHRLPCTLEGLYLPNNCFGITENEGMALELVFPRSLKHLDLSSNPSLFTKYQLRRFLLPDGLLELVLSNTGLSSIHGVDFPSTIRTLDLEENPLTSKRPRAHTSAGVF